MNTNDITNIQVLEQTNRQYCAIRESVLRHDPNNKTALAAVDNILLKTQSAIYEIKAQYHSYMDNDIAERQRLENIARES